MLKKHKRQIIYTILLGIVLFMHVFMIDRIPRGLNVDEIGSACDAYTLGRFGVDRWRESWPVYLTNYRDGQNILYTYLLVPIFLIFGTSTLTIRSVIIVSALITGIFGAKAFRMIEPEENSDLIFLGLFSVLPVFTIILRFGLESHLMLSTSAIMLYFALKSIVRNRDRDFLLLGIFSGLVLYTYAISYFCVPLFLFLLLVYLVYVKKVTLKQFFLTFLPFLLLGLPLALVQVINYFDLPEIKIGIFTFTKLSKYRVSELTLRGFFKKILQSAFHTVFYDGVNYNSTPKFGNFYYVSVPFILIGFIHGCRCLFLTIKNRSSEHLEVIPLLWAFCVYFFAGFLSDAPGYTNLTRMNGVLISLILFLAEGIFTCHRLITEKTKFQKQFAILITALYSCHFLFFAHYYFFTYDKDAYPYKWLFFEPYDEAALQYVQDDSNGYQDAQVYLPFVYTYYLWWTKANPYDTMIDLESGKDPEQIGRFHFMEQGRHLSGEYLFYDRGYSEEEINLFRSWHFREHPFGPYLLMTDPLGQPDFFGDYVSLSKEVTLKKSYLDALDEVNASFYGWLIPEGVTDLQVSLELDDQTLECELIPMEEDGLEQYAFIFQFPFESFYSSSKKDFHLSYLNADGELIHIICPVTNKKPQA